MTTVTKYTNASAAGAEVDARAQRHAAETKCDYRDAVRMVLKADPELERAYAQPASQATTTPAVPVPTSVPLAQGKTPGETVHLRTVALMESDASLTYQMAVNLVLAADSDLKTAYARI
jgi:hypothetical protein